MEERKLTDEELEKAAGGIPGPKPNRRPTQIYICTKCEETFRSRSKDEAEKYHNDWFPYCKGGSIELEEDYMQKHF